MLSDAVIPDVAIQWIVQYSCETNSNLAAVSNVNRKWRALVQAVLGDMLLSVADSSKMSIESNDSESRTNISQYKYLSRLLLPEMALEIVRKFQTTNQNGFLKSPNEASFCLAWFPPEGIQVQKINGDAYSDEELFSSDGSDAFGESSDDDNEEMAFYRERLQQRANELKSGHSDHDFITSCSHEWQGYRDAIDILAPLGFSTMFIQSILRLAEKLACQDNNTVNELDPPDKHDTTYAVRGAVFARPYSFCLCWDADQAQSKIMNQMSNLNADTSDENMMYKLMDLKRRKKMHDKVRRTRMREALPRVILSSPVKNPILQDPAFGILNGRGQRCLQFLNVDGSKAVYLRTPPFACGAVKCPVTMFCVGIATEDGCFVSGLDNRFELGHLHGIDEMDKSIDMSPICICAENNKHKEYPHEGGEFDRQIVRSYSEDMSDSSCDDYQIKRKGSILCQCQIQYHEKNDDDSSAEKSSIEVNQANILRGQIGPGRWHCYTAIFDGSNSTIRVDGCTDRIKNSCSNTQSQVGAVLDGLTIGSDHCFEMPLCFGAGSEGEGEGSISELAVFNGALPIEDVEKYERYLMQKHGIVHGQQQIYPQQWNQPVIENNGNQWQEDLWRRQAHAMIVHPPRHEIGGASIPLRVAARHRSVAWHRSNEVTGKAVQVSRIGSKQSHGSSDW